jgi:hypothetical protein
MLAFTLEINFRHNKSLTLWQGFNLLISLISMKSILSLTEGPVFD